MRTWQTPPLFCIFFSFQQHHQSSSHSCNQTTLLIVCPKINLVTLTSEPLLYSKSTISVHQQTRHLFFFFLFLFSVDYNHLFQEQSSFLTSYSEDASDYKMQQGVKTAKKEDREGNVMTRDA